LIKKRLIPITPLDLLIKNKDGKEKVLENYNTIFLKKVIKKK